MSKYTAGQVEALITAAEYIDSEDGDPYLDYAEAAEISGALRWLAATLRQHAERGDGAVSDEAIAAWVERNDLGPMSVSEARAVVEDAATLGAIDQHQQAERCPYCDNTGDVHSIDGEWRGECHECKARHAERGDGAVSDEAIAAWVERNDLGPMSVSEARAVVEDAATLGAIDQHQQAERCPYCDNTGDVHSIDGEWRGECHECKARHAERGDGAVSAWREEWAGSDPGRGWYIRESTGINGRVVAYLGENIASELVREVIAAHNASLFIGKPEECADACPPQQVCDYCQAVAPLLRAPAEQGGRVDVDGVAAEVSKIVTEADRMGYMVDTAVPLDTLRSVLIALAQNVARPNVTGWAKGDDYTPEEINRDMATAGIHIGDHSNAIECYADTLEKAAAIRDSILSAQNAHGIDHVGELLAVIHGDGGHYAAEHGTQKAATDALVKVHAMMLAIAQNAQEEAVAIVVEQDPTYHTYPRAITHTYPIRTADDLLRPGTKLYTHAERARVPEVTYEMVRTAEHFCPTDLPHLDKQRWKARKLNELLAAAPSQPEDAESRQCDAIVEDKGYPTNPHQCSRKAKPGSKYCAQHGRGRSTTQPEDAA